MCAESCLTNRNYDSLHPFFKKYILFLSLMEIVCIQLIWDYFLHRSCPGAVKNTCLITSQLHVATNTVSLEASRCSSVHMHSMQRLTCSVGLIIKLFLVLATKIACKLLRHCNFCFPLASNPSAQTHAGCSTVASSHSRVADVMRTVWDLLCSWGNSFWISGRFTEADTYYKQARWHKAGC